MTAQFRVDLLVTPSHQFFDGSGVLSGLAALDKLSTIDLRIRRGSTFDPGHRALVCLGVTHSSGDHRRVVIDLADRSDHVSLRLLEWADVYYKRSYSSASLGSLPIDRYRRKIKPYGLNLACLGRAATPAHIRAAAALFTDRMVGMERKPLRAGLREFVNICRMAPFLPSPRAFEASGPRPPTTRVVLQTRIWSPVPSVDNLELVNGERIALVRALKQAFGSEFLGGIVADEFSVQNCPSELLVRQNVKRGAYVKLVKSALTGVYTRGLHRAIAIKMAEYLAAGLCIVSEPIAFEVPVPLVEGVNYLSFRNPQECVEQCVWLQSHPDDAARMRTANIEYYRKWVSPEALVRNLLSRAFE